MGRIEIDHPGSAVSGVRFHKPSGHYIAEVGYHQINRVAADGTVTTTRVRTTHYLGDIHSREEAEVRYESIKRDWVGWPSEQRKAYDAENVLRRSQNLPPLERFKPVWPKVRVRRERLQKPTRSVVLPTPGEVRPTPLRGNAVLSQTIRDARDLFVADLKKRIGLQGGKGINQNTFTKSVASLDLALALNTTYTRTERPIDVNLKLGELTLDDLEAFVRFWCNPNHVKSPRTGLNYVRAFRQMLLKLKVPRQDGFDEVFKLKIPRNRKIAAYDADVLRLLLNCEDQRARLVSLLCLNCGFYAVDIVRLMPEDITDADGSTQDGGHYISKAREKTSHQNDFKAIHWLWPETKALLEKYRARSNPFGTYLLSGRGNPYHVKTVTDLVERVIRANGFNGKFSVKQFRKVGASQIKALAGSDAMHQYKSNAMNAADSPYILEDYTILTNALRKFREKLIRDGALVEGSERKAG